MRSKLVILGLGALALTAAPVQAQKPSFGVAAGFAMPQGKFKDIADNGLNGTVALGFGVPMVPVGLRLEGSYNRFPGKKSVFGQSGNLTVASATANVTLGLPMSAIVVSPYLIAGGGMYWAGCSFSSCTTDKKFGYNAGLGIKLHAVLASAYIEARYHSVQTPGDATTYLPVTIGIMF